MPDKTKTTVSASQLPALLGRHRHLTRWLLWQHFANNLQTDPEEDGRMKWGKLMQPLVLREAGEQLRLDASEYPQDYIARAPIGCTPDGYVVDPQRGPGWVETKCVFDYRQWMERWGGGDYVPADTELQLQAQLAVGDGVKHFEWGVIAAWVAGEVHLFERRRDPELTDQIVADAQAFLDSVKAGDEPDPAGVPVEAPAYARLWAVARPDPQVVDDPAALLAAREFIDAKEKLAFWTKAADETKAKVLALARDFAETRLAGGAVIRVKRSTIPAATISRKESIRTTLNVFVPLVVTAPSEPPPATVLGAG